MRKILLVSGVAFFLILLFLLSFHDNQIQLKVINKTNDSFVFKMEENNFYINMPLLKRFNSSISQNFIDNPLPCNKTQIYTGFIVPLKPTNQTTNNDCIRANKDYTITKPNNTFRVIVLGDSFIFGEGVRDNETLSALLEKKFNEQNQTKKYEFMNFGVPGYNTKLEVNRLIKKGLKYQPDMVLLGYVSNDCEDAIAMKNIDYYLSKVLEKRNLSVQNVWEIRKQLDYSRYFPFNQTFLVGVEQPLHKLFGLSKKYNFSVIIFSYPLGGYVREKEYLKRLENLSNKYNFPFYYLTQEINYESKGVWIQAKKDPHPTYYANKKTADFLAPIIDYKFQN